MNVSLSMEEQFKQKLAQLHTDEKKSVLISKNEYFNLVDEVKEAASVAGTSKTWRQYYILKRYQIHVSVEAEIALRTAVQLESKCGGQGFVKCNCSGAKRCSTNRCKCFKSKVKCNSRCHTALGCDNKIWLSWINFEMAN